MNKKKQKAVEDITTGPIEIGDVTELEAKKTKKPKAVKVTKKTKAEADKQKRRVATRKKGKIKTEMIVKKYSNLDGSAKEIQFNEGEKHLKEMAIVAGYVEGRPASSIFGYARFPTIGQSNIIDHTFTPKDILTLLYKFSIGTKPIAHYLKEQEIGDFKYYALLRQYPVIKQIEGLARSFRADNFGKKAIAVYEDDIPEEFIEATKFGERISNSGSTIMRDKSALYFKMAQVQERSAYNTTKDAAVTVHIEATNSVVNLGDIMKKGIDELSDL